MPTRDLEAWMWSEAVRMLDRAERMERQFFRRGAPRRPQWEPPVDVYETGDALWVVAAVPGVGADCIVVEIAEDILTIAGERRLPEPAQRGAVHRVEIPHGRFERRLALPPRSLEMAGRELVDGCLYIKLRKV